MVSIYQSGLSMKRVAVFGNTGGGKSILSRRLSELTGLPWYPLDLIQYREGGGRYPHEQYLQAHGDLLRRDQWIIDGFGCVPSSWERFAAADTLVYIDLPLSTHYWFVTKRLVSGMFKTPAGWPARSPIWKSTISSYKTVGECDRVLTPQYRQLVADMAGKKSVHHLRSRREVHVFLQSVTPQHDRSDDDKTGSRLKEKRT